MSEPSQIAIESTLQELRVFPPPPEFAAKAHVKSFEEYEQIYNESIKHPEEFWAQQAENLHWFKSWDKILDWQEPHAKWFIGGEINASDNCLDRHLETTRADKTAIIWEGEPGEIRTFTYREIHKEVCKFSNVLKKLGVGKGDRVALYMPLVPELAMAMLACARIGATHTVIFGGFSADAIRDRVNDCDCRLIVTADGGFRRGSEIKLKEIVDEAAAQCPNVENVVVLKRTGSHLEMKAGRDHWWHELMENVDENCEAEKLDSEHPLFILYTSGTTGKPKGILHTTGGYLTQVSYTAKMVFDLKEDGCLLVYGGHRLDYGSQLCRLRNVRQWRDRFDV